mmetsp:Transcript_38448/g.81519  ORF Transcript_38448/g.81519 Transcript_38448/m.81519 type:complete len:175 (-) Transcript_38448:946-1470(-)
MTSGPRGGIAAEYSVPRTPSSVFATLKVQAGAAPPTTTSTTMGAECRGCHADLRVASHHKSPQLCSRCSALREASPQKAMSLTTSQTTASTTEAGSSSGSLSSVSGSSSASSSCHFRDLIGFLTVRRPVLGDPFFVSVCVIKYIIALHKRPLGGRSVTAVFRAVSVRQAQEKYS